MNNYVFLIPSVCNIGGAILYLINKIHYLEKNGWKVDVYYARKDKILVKELEKYSPNCYPFIDYSVMYFRTGFVEQYANRISSEIRKKMDGDIVIESCTVSLSTWGEIIASRLKCKHICFAFEELFELSYSQMDFLYFKHLRHELAGITLESVPMMFNGNPKYKIENPEFYSARAVATIMDVDYKLTSKIKEYDVVIGSLGRLDKGFVWPALIEIEKYINMHAGRKYAVLLIGDTKDDGYKKRIYNLFKGKASLFVTGEIWPVPRELVKGVDVFVSSSGAASSTAIENVPTISVSPATFLPNGILNYTTDQTLFATKPSPKSISELIEDVIENHFCEKYPCMHMYDNFWVKREESNAKEFDRQIRIALDRQCSYKYYDVLKIKNKGVRRLVALYSKLVGARTFLMTMSFMRKHVGTLIRG